MFHWLEFMPIFWITFVSAVLPVSTNISPNTTSTTVEDGNPLPINYTQAVHDELIKVIEIVKAHTYAEKDVTTGSSSPQKRKFQDEEDYIAEGLIEVQSLVPMIFKLVGSAIALNSSGLVEGSFGLLPEGLSNRLTNVLGTLATSLLGPGVLPTTTIRPRRRRRSTTTVASVTEILEENSTVISTGSESSSVSNSVMFLNVTSDVDAVNGTELGAEDLELPTTTDVLFKQSSLGELPVYAAAYAPNYVATTPYPVYANHYLHVLYPAPSTTTIPTTTTTTTESTTSTDPNSYAIALPFDYQESIGTGTDTAATPINNEGNIAVDMGMMGNTDMPTNVTYSPLLQQTPPEYGEYEYEEQTEEAAVLRSRDNEVSKSLQLFKSLAQRSNPTELGLQEYLKAEDEDDEYAENDANTHRSLGRISRFLYGENNDNF